MHFIVHEAWPFYTCVAVKEKGEDGPLLFSLKSGIAKDLKLQKCIYHLYKCSSKEETLEVAWTCGEYVDRTSLCHGMHCLEYTWLQLFKSWITLCTGKIDIYSVDSVIHLPKNYIADKSETLDNEETDSRKGEKRGGPLGGVGSSNSLCYR